ncbi:MAG: hypothetical protein VX030_01225, partial [SAR324 cluster bacterium]|nr:hypothetical protein [SAR324 cluster bacterium]
MVKIKILIFIVFSGLFLSACDSSGTQEENSTIDLSSKPDGPKDPEDPEDPNFQVSVVTPVTTITTSYSPDYVFYSNRTGSISYNGSCVGNRTEAVVGNNTMKIYSASSTPPVYIPLSSGQYESCVLTVTDSEGVQKTLKIDEFVVTDPNSQTGQILLELETSLGGSSSSRIQSSRTDENQPMNMRSVESGASARSNTISAAQVRLLILAGAKTVQESNLLNSSDMTLAMPVIIEGTMKKMSKIGLSGEDTSILVSSLIVGSLMKSIDKRKTHLDSSTTDSQQTPLQTLMSRMSKMTIKNLRSAGISAEKITNASSTLVSTMIQNLDEAGLGADDISTAVESISSGSVGTLGEIEGID